MKYQIFTHQIGKTHGVMEICNDIDHFKQTIQHQKLVSIAPYLFDEMNRIID